MQLFEAEALVWEKIASVELEEDATQWPRQVLTELFRTLPEISEYTPEVKFLKTNEEQGYAVGVVVVSNGTNSAIASTNSITEAPKALIPLVIKNGKLSPLDTLMSSSGKMFPLTVERLREVLYRPETFDLITEDWGDAGLWQLFAPPGQSLGGGGMGGMGSMAPQTILGPGMKTSALLERIDGSIFASDVEKLADALREDEALRKVAVENPAMREVLLQLVETRTIDNNVGEFLKVALDEHFPADVAFLRYDEGADRYEVKLAHRSTGREASDYLPRGDFLRFAGQKLAEQVDREGTVIAAKSDGKAKVVVGAGGATLRPIESSGYYTVYNAISGAPLRGWAITHLIDGTGTKLPITLFVNEDGATTQDDIAGHFTASEQSLPPSDPPKGHGCFVVRSNSYEMHATVPLTVQGAVDATGALRYDCVDVTGEKITVVLQRGMQSIVAFPDRHELILPRDTTFVSIERPFPPLVSKGEEVAKVASEILQGRIRVTGAPGAEGYYLELQQLPKLAAKLHEGTVLDADSAFYTLCLAGLDSLDAFTALRKVAQVGRCEVLCQDLGSLPELEPEKFAAEVAEIRSLRPNLVKEAATLPDTMTVDAVLGLDFINSENVRVFISMIPYLEKALNKICELIFASRLGLSEIPETAASRAARGLNESIHGLKALALRQIEELP